MYHVSKEQGLYVWELFAKLNNSQNKGKKLSVTYAYMLHWVMTLMSIIFKVRISNRIFPLVSQKHQIIDSTASLFFYFF